MQKRRLGQTEIMVSELGLGTVKFGRVAGVKYPETFTLPSDQEAMALLSLAKECGINLLDTAPSYGTSEERLGKCLKGTRHDWVISTKVGEAFVQGQSVFDFSSSGMKASVEQSLRRLQTDYLDIVLVHSNGDDTRLILEEGVFDTLSELKVAGKIRAFGMSTKTVEGGLLTVKEADIAMVTYHPLYQEERAVIEAAYQMGKGIFIKKAFASGHLQHFQADDPVRASLQFIFATPGVSAVIIGTINPLHLRENVDTFLSL